MALLDNLFKKTLYYPGCTAKFIAKDIQTRHEKLLQKFGIKYIKLQELEVCCGKPALDYGYKEDFEKLVKQNIDNFHAQGIKRIITSCPVCYSVFLKYYSEDFEIEHITKTILDNIRRIEKKSDEKITFFDSCNSDKLQDLYNNPREILKKLGYKLQELEFNKEHSMCCGKSLKLVSPKVAKSMAEALLESVPSKKLIVLSPDCFTHLLENNNKGIKIVELSEVLI
jgi:Fe-S oxidoreductase